MAEPQADEQLEVEAAAPEEGAEQVEAAPTAEGQRAEEAHEDLSDVTHGAVAEIAEDIREQVASVDTFFEEDGTFKLEYAIEVAAYIPVEVLNEIEARKPGALMDLFTEGDDQNFEINFRGNRAADSLIGLSWILKHKPGIRVVEVTYPAVKGGHSRTGHRQGFKGSFYDKEGYVEIHSGYRVSVVREFADNSPALMRLRDRVDNAVADFESSKDDPRFQDVMVMLDNEKYRRISEDPAEVAKIIVETSANYGVDPYLTMAILKLENGSGGRFFGAPQEGALGFGIQLELMLRNIREHEVSYKAISGERALKGGKYSVTFLSYFAKVYSPDSATTDKFDTLHRSYFKYRGESVPSNVQDEIAKGRQLADQYMSGMSLRKHTRRPVTREQIDRVLMGGVKMSEIVDSPSIRLSSPFGMRFHPIDHVHKPHRGIDIGAPLGAPVKSWRNGEVIFAGVAGGYGNLVKVRHPDGSETRYAHLNSINVRKGQRVDKGEQLGTIGSTGKSTGPHLHFEIRINGQAIDPMGRN